MSHHLSTHATDDHVLILPAGAGTLGAAADTAARSAGHDGHMQPLLLHGPPAAGARAHLGLGAGRAAGRAGSEGQRRAGQADDAVRGEGGGDVRGGRLPLWLFKGKGGL